MREPTRQYCGEGCHRERLKPDSIRSNDTCSRSRRGSGDGMSAQESNATREAPLGGEWVHQPDAREGRSGPAGVTERLVVPLKPGNSGGGKEPQLKVSAGSDEERRKAVPS